MKTRRIHFELDEAAELIQNGQLVAVPTETVYGLAGNGLDQKAVESIYEVKGRPAVKPLSLMVPGPKAMPLYCDPIPKAAVDLAEKFWPGPLTIVLKAREIVPEIVRAGGDTVGLRCPDHPMTLDLLRYTGLPFAAPSANPSGEPSPKTAEDVLQYFDGKISAVVDGGPCGIGKESTLLDMSVTPYRILRQGALSREEIADALVDRMTILGITGGSGSGKTTALNAIRSRGALVLDCDAIYHELLQSDAELISGLQEAFPGCVLDGRVDRGLLAAAVFSDPEALEALNRLTHPRVTARVRELLREHAMSGGALAAVDAVELFAGGIDQVCDLTIAVTASVETRVQRIMRRDGISRERALARIQAQKPDSYYSDRCDVTLTNNEDEHRFLSKFIDILKENKLWTN